MGATAFIVLLAGLALPIVLILTAVLVDLLALLWAAFRIGHDELMPAAIGWVHRHVAAPVVRNAHSPGVVR